MMQPIPDSLLREAQASSSGHWRGLEELANSAEFQQRLLDEFPQGASLWASGKLGRRKFIKLLGASLGLAGLTACTRRSEDPILPYVRQPEDILPGQPLYYATAMPWQGFARGILVEAHMGRPTKIEGNPDHPYSLGATDAVTQAAVLDLYNPDRSQSPRHEGVPDTWSHFERELLALREAEAAAGGAHIGLLFEPSSSPSFLRQLAQLREQMPAVRFFSHRPLMNDLDRAELRPVFDFSKADLVLSIDCDFLESLPGSLRHAREFSDRRRVTGDGTAQMNRLIVMESNYSLTGSMADQRLPLPPDALLKALAAIHDGLMAADARPAASEDDAIASICRELRAAPGRSLVLAGEHLPREAHALTHAINARLGNLGQTLRYIPNPLKTPEGTEGLDALLEASAAGELRALLCLSGNPAYSAPAGVNLSAALQSLPWTAHFGTEYDETARACRWHLPEAHFLETWSDLRACDGSATIQQPLIQPLYQGRSVHQLLNRLLGLPADSARAAVMDTWRNAGAADRFNDFWQDSLHDGLVPESAFESVLPDSNPYGPVPTSSALPEETTETARYWACFRPDSSVGDGRWAGNPWLQELPRSMTMLVWDNAALIAPATAKELELVNGDVVKLTLAEHAVEAPVWILPGQPARCITLPLGYGRSFSRFGGDGVGFNSYRIRPSTTPWNASGLRIEKTGKRHPLVTTQLHHAMQGRHLAVTASLDQFRDKPDFLEEKLHAPAPEETLYPRWPRGAYAWGMTIDLNVCTGCRACVVACQAENNIPVVGKEQVAMGREMHWIRVDRYFEGEPDAPRSVHQPVPCMHCENAPCEVVCPVAATVHSNSGLNEMVYNRCVGTRYCSNNCPYKVRRFNFLSWGAKEEPQSLQHNPDVTVRMRGIMEKCTFCVQRINQARIAAKQEDRRIRDGEIVPACAQACPTRAIVFGDLNDPASLVSRHKEHPLNYSLLAELNTRPRTTYLARLQNEDSGS